MENIPAIIVDVWVVMLSPNSHSQYHTYFDQKLFISKEKALRHQTMINNLDRSNVRILVLKKAAINEATNECYLLEFPFNLQDK